MRLPILALVVAATVAALPLALSAQDAPGSTPPAMQVQMTKNGNVRLAPSRDAPVVVTLPAGSQVEVLGAAEGAGDEWVVVRFPRAGKAWVHNKLLQPTGEPGKLRAVVDGVKVRSDSTQSASVITELALGEIVEADEASIAAGQSLGWIRVFPPKAVAYVSKTVLGQVGAVAPVAVPAPAGANPAAVPAPVAVQNLDQQWAELLGYYNRFRKSLDLDPKGSLLLDWAWLNERFRAIAANPVIEASMRDSAAKYADAIAGIVQTSKQYQRDTNQKAVKELPWMSDPRHQEAPASPSGTAPAPANPGTVAGTTPAPANPGATGTTPAAPAANPVGWIGWVEQRDAAGYGASFVMLDANGNPVVVLKQAEGSTVMLSEYVWRKVLVTGTLQAKADGATLAPVLIKDIKLLER